MSWPKPVFWKKLLAFTLVCIISSFLVFPGTPVAQANVWDDFIDLFRQPDGAPPAGRNSGGAGRGPICASSDEALKNQSGNTVIALVPEKPENSANPSENNLDNSSETSSSEANFSETQVVGGYTVTANPTFWFYLPYTATPATPDNRVAQFVLLNHADRRVWNELMMVELTDRPQLVEYPLPVALDTGELYKWYFSVICDSEKLSRNPVVRGWVQRKASTPKLQADLRNADRFKQYLAYGNNEFWFDAVNSLVKIRRQFPSTNRQDWIDLLDHFEIPRLDRFNVLEPVQPIQREEVNGNQFPARIYGDQ